MKRIIIIFITGILILSGAIIMNLMANLIGLVTWYDFLLNLNSIKINNISINDFFSLIYLFLVYPFTLGLIAYLSLKSISKLKRLEA
jgi:hypothetical protein